MRRRVGAEMKRRGEDVRCERMDGMMTLTRVSNYWTAALYFRAQNGTFKRVQQYANLGLVQRGGMTVYYIPPYDGVSKTTAFAPVSLLLLLHQLFFAHPPSYSFCSIVHASYSLPPSSLQQSVLTSTSPGLPHARRQPHPAQHDRRIPRHLPSLRLQKRHTFRWRPLHRGRHNLLTNPHVRRRHQDAGYVPDMLGWSQSRFARSSESCGVCGDSVRAVSFSSQHRSETLREKLSGMLLISCV